MQDTESEAIVPRRHDHAVVAPLSFIRPLDGVKPQFLSAAINGGRERFDFDVVKRDVAIEDIRAWAVPPSLDREGFSVLTKTSAVLDLYDDAAITHIYRPEVEVLVADALGAEVVVAFDVTRRSDDPVGAANPDGARGPLGQIHVDYTKQSGPKRAAEALGAERVAQALADGKAIVQVNVWRPIVGPVLRSPLAFADASTIRPDDLVATNHIFPERVGEIYYLAAAPGQRFGYMSRMTPNEVVLIKGWDSREDGRARFTPHTAFALPDQDGAPPRHSIEVRTYAIVPLMGRASSMGSCAPWNAGTVPSRSHG